MIEAQRRGVVVDLTGGPVALLAVVRRLGADSAATVVGDPAVRIPVILDQPGRPSRRLTPGFGFKGGPADLYSAFLRTEAPGGAARVRLVSR
ncbi:MAG: hypothetical protein OXJ62_05490 [Spirochaetaceae bacterium]|nr:hypothetical protein [Spirochaetaceae bacterium]